MKVKFDTFDAVNEYIRQIHDVESDIDIISGRFIVDGKSVLALHSLDKSKVLEIRVTEKVPGDTERVYKLCESLGILYHGE